MRWLKYLFIGLISLVIASVAMAITLVLLLEQDQFRDALVYSVNSATDHQLEINGPLEVDFSLSPLVKVSDTSFKTATNEFELSAADIHIQVDIMSLFSKHLVVHKFLARDSTINIRQLPAEDGHEDEDEFTWPSEIYVPTVENVNVENLVINYLQEGETEPLHINLDSLTLDHKAGEPIALTSAGTIDGAEFHLEGEFGEIASLIKSDQPYPVKFSFDLMQFIIHAEGEIANPHEAGDLDIAMEVAAPDVQGLLKLLHVDAPDVGQLSATYRLAGTINAPQMNDIDISVTKDKVTLQVTGAVGNILTAEDTKIDFSTVISDKELLAWLLPDESPVFHSIQSSGTLSVSPGALVLSDFTVEASDPKGHKLKIEGNTRIVDAAQPMRDLNATLSIASPDTAYLKQFIDDIPMIGPVAGSARVSTNSDVLVIEDIKLTVGNKQSVKTEVKGNIRHIIFTPTVDVSKMDLTVELAGTSARVIGDLINTGLPDIGPVTLKANYSGSITKSSLKDLHLHAGRPKQLQVEVRGDIKLAALDGDKPLAGLDLNINFHAPSTASLTAIAGTEIPALGRLKGSATIRDTSGIPGITALDINVQKGNDLRLTLKGVLADLEKMNGLDMKVDLVAADMNVIGQVFDQSLPEEGNVKLSGRVKGSLEQTRFTGRVNLRNTTIETDLTGAFTGERPRLVGSISTPDLDVHDLGYYPDKRVEKKSTPANEEGEWYAGQHEDKKKKTVKTEPLFSKEPIDLSGLKAIDLDLEIKINELSSIATSLESIYSHIFLENGKLVIRPVKLLIDSDVINVDGTVNASTKPLKVSLLITGDNIDLGLLLENPATKTTPIRGVMTARADMRSRGQSAAELAARLDGHVYLVTENAKVKRSVMNLVNVDILGFVISNILSPKKDVNVDCAIFSMHFDKGIGKTDLFLMDTPDTLIRVDADVNLVNETMDIAILPEYKIRLLKKSKPMKIYGPITNPTYKVVSLVDLTRETTRSALLAPVTISKGLLDNITGLIVKPDEAKGSCDRFLE